MLSSLKIIRLEEVFIYFIHVLGLFYFLGVSEAPMKILVLTIICLLLIYNWRLLKIPKHFILLYLSFIFYVKSSDSISTFIDYSPPFLIFFLGAHLTPIFKNIPKNKINKILQNLIYLSVIGTILKLFVFGIDESYLVGFMTMSAGEIGVLFPAFMLVFFSKVNIQPKKFYVFVAYLFFFGVINEKRSVIFLLPILYFILKSFSFRKLLLYAVFFYPIAISIIPSLNREEKVFGPIDPFYPFEYSFKYLTAGYSSDLQGSFEEAVVDQNVQFGRIALAGAILNQVSNVELSTFLFGSGLGRFTNNYSLDDGTQDNLFWEFGFRGNLNSFLLFLLESGVLCFLFLFLFLLQHLRRYSKGVFYTSFLFIYFFDIFLYSQTLVKILPLNLYLFTLIPALYEEN